MSAAIFGQIACFLFSAALIGFSFFRKDVQASTRMMSVFCSFCLVIIGAIGPQSLLNVTIKAGDNEFSFNRHVPSEAEKASAFQLISSDASEEELESNPLVQAALSRSSDERSSVDYLLLSHLEKKRENPSRALELAYTGIGIEQRDPVVQAGLKQVIGESFEAVGEKKISREYLKEAVKIPRDVQYSPRLQRITPLSDAREDKDDPKD